MGWWDRHILHVAAALACVTCLLAGIAIGLQVGGHTLFTIFHTQPRTVLRTVHAPARTVTIRGKARPVSTQTDTTTQTVPTTATSTITATATTTSTVTEPVT